MLKRLLLMKQIPLSPNFARLAMRIVIFGTLFLKHGTEKLFSFHAMTQTFVAHNLDPVHIGPIPSLLFATFADGICTFLIMIGLATRLAATILFINVFVVWSLMEHFAFFGHNADHAELVVLYLGGCLMMIFGGAGRFSVDALLDRTESESSETAGRTSMARA